MNKKGFTLIEALLVIAIIGVLLLTLIPSVITIINKNKEKAFESNRNNIVAAAKMYVAENKYNLPINCSSTDSENHNVYLEVSLDNLIGYGNLSSRPNGFPNVWIEYNCLTKEFNYNYKKKDSSTYTYYTELKYDEYIDNSDIDEEESETSYTVKVYKYLVGKNTKTEVGQIIEGGNITSITIYPGDYYEYIGTECTSEQDFTLNSKLESYGDKVEFSINRFVSDGECTIYFEQQ